MKLDAVLSGLGLKLNLGALTLDKVVHVLLLILVGVILDTLQQIESYLLLRHYDGLMKTGRIKGRSA